MAWQLSSEADADVGRIYLQGAAAYGLEQAEHYGRRLFKAFDLIASQPRMAKERTEVRPGLRAHPCGVHIILYTIEDTGILIFRIRHMREDWRSNELGV
ncbi:MAG: type II toxin-antitoxin system RelE/ParE family toxin [Phyllobacteriaceae bacterium]|nr:type II toxin-antitoxin system RelE/ParE family toxin [Phyllobacteriaceae bacterium]